MLNCHETKFVTIKTDDLPPQIMILSTIILCLNLIVLKNATDHSRLPCKSHETKVVKYCCQNNKIIINYLEFLWGC